MSPNIHTSAATMYLNLIQIAESFGVSEQVITEWVRNEGMPHVHDRERILFERSQVMDWAASHGLGGQAGFLSEPAPSLAKSQELDILLRRGGVWRGVKPEELNSVFERIVRKLPGLPAPVLGMLVKRICAPGGVTMAPVGGGFALPHPSMRVSLGETSALIALIELDAPWTGNEPPDAVPITRLLFFISPTPRLHVNMLGLLARSIASGQLKRALDDGADDSALYQALAASPDQTPAPAKGAAR